MSRLFLRTTAKNVREAREEWRETVLGEIDFQEAITDRIEDPEVREEAQQKIDHALSEIVQSGFMLIIENLPQIPAEQRDALPVRSRRRLEDRERENDGDFNAN